MSTAPTSLGTFGELSLPDSQGSPANYRSLSTPKMSEGVRLLTYVVDTANRAVELPPSTIQSPEVKIDSVGHITLIGQ